MNLYQYGVLDDEDEVIAPMGMSRDEAIRMACHLGDGHTPMRRLCGDWQTFNTGVVDPCLSR